MTNEQIKDLEREAERKDRLSQFIRGRMMAMELGVEIVWMNFATGEALLKFSPETAQNVAAMAGAR